MIIVLKGSNSIPDYGEVPLSELSDLGDAEITLRRKDSSGMASSFTKDITFSGGAFQYIKEHLVISPRARVNTILMQVIDDCCQPHRLIYTGSITSKSIDFCLLEDYKVSSCKITASSEEYDEVALVRKSLISKNNRWSDGKLFWDRVGVQIPYCEEIRPASMHYFRFFVAVFALITFQILAILLYTIGLIVGIINVLVLLFGGRKVSWSDMTVMIEPLRNFMYNELPRWGIGCGYTHYAILVRDYIQNAIEGFDASIRFESSIFNNPNSVYNDTILLYSPTQEGEFTYFTDANNIDHNLVNSFFTRDSPNWTLGELLDKLKDVFNAKWWIEGKTIHFEPILNLSTPDIWIDIDALEKGMVKDICLKWVDAPNYIGARLKFQNDGFDACSDEAAYLYNDTVQYNPLTASQGKLLDVQLQFAPARFRGDGIKGDPISFFSSVLFIFALVGLSDLDMEFENDMLLSSGKVSIAKLLIPVSGFKRSDVKIIHKSGPEGLNYNYPYWFNASYGPYNPSGYYDDQPNSKKRKEGENLFQFYRTTDPHNLTTWTEELGQSFEITLDGNCNIYNGMFDSGGKLKEVLRIRLIIDNIVRVGTIDEISITNNTFKLTGVL